MMKLPWKLRILLGPMRPFLLRKVVDSVRLRIDRLRYTTHRQIPIHEGLTLSKGLFPLPSQEWFALHGKDVLHFARSMRAGKVGAYGIATWNVGDADPLGVDVRSVHELSRMHHWCAYALAAHLEPHRAHEWAEVLEHEIETFASAYPADSSVHWAFPMGNGIRVFSMLVAWDWIRRSGWEHLDMDRFVAGFAAEHGRRIYVERESRGGLSTSHYAANLLGMLAVEKYVSGALHLPAWSAFLRRELQRELLRQILPDGMVQEASTGYHRHVVDIYTMASCLVADEPSSISASMRERLAKGLAALDVLERAGMPLIGDNDDGMAMKVTGLSPSTSLLRDVAQRFLPVHTISDGHHTFGDFGLDVWSGAICVTLRNGSVGQFGKGGHAHNDQNSITVAIDGIPVITDPGTFCYTASVVQRNRERSVHAHATMWPPDTEQAFIPPGEAGFFWMLGSDVTTKVVERSATKWVGEVRHRSGFCHRRSMYVDSENGVTGIDELFDANGKGLVGRVCFTFAPGLTLVLHEGKLSVGAASQSCVLTFDGTAAELIDGYTAPAFGVQAPSQILVCTGARINWALRRS